MLADRCVLEIKGANLTDFLQGLCTNDLSNINSSRIIYTCILNPKGRFLFDFFIIYQDKSSLLLDIHKSDADILPKFLHFYDTSKSIDIKLTKLYVRWGLEFFDGSFADPRSYLLGFRSLSSQIAPDIQLDYHYNRIKHSIPEGLYDMEREKSIILEFGLDNFNAISFTKGCYLGQELMSRTKHLGEIKKTVITLKTNAENPIRGKALFSGSGEEVGFLLSYSKDLCLGLIYKQHADNDVFFNENKQTFAKLS